MNARNLTLTAVALALGLSAAPSAAQSVAGTWVLDVGLAAGSGQATFELEVEGSTITGTYVGILGEQEVTGTVDGSSVEFGFESPDAGAVHFEGTVEGTTMEGTCQYGQLGSGTFSGTKSS